MTPSPIERALDSIGRERRSVRDECEAFDRFRERVRPLSIESRTAGGDPATPAAVLESYRETVMATGDYGCIYDESLEEHLSKELGERIAERLRTAGALDGRLKRDLLSAAVQARERRERLLRRLEAEEASVTAAADELTAIRERVAEIPPCSTLRQPLDRVIDGWRTLDRLAARCEAVAAERQQYVFEDRSTGSAGAFVLDEYLYGGLETTHPVLSEVATTAAEIREKRTTDAGIDGYTDMTA